MDAGLLPSTLPNSIPNTAWYFVPLFTLALLFNRVICGSACFRFVLAEKKKLLANTAGALAIVAKESELRSVERQGQWGSPIRNTEDGWFGIIAIMANCRYFGFAKLQVRNLLFLRDYSCGVLRLMGVIPSSVFLQ